MRCYPRYIKETWSKVFHNDKRAILKVDRTTVEAFQLRAPGACEAEARYLSEQLQGGQIFRAFSAAKRQAIWTEVLAVSTDCLTPSFFTFFDDINYLQGPFDSLSQAIKLGFDQYMAQESDRIYLFR